MKEILLNQLYENCESKKFFDIDDVYGSESPFEEEVYYRVAEKIGPGRLQQQYPIGGFRIDLVVKSKVSDKPIIAIECDGAKYHSSNEAYAWDIFRQNRLEQNGFLFYRIWSTNWWNNPNRELEKLIHFIYENEVEKNEDLPDEYEHLYKDDIIYPITNTDDASNDLSVKTTINEGLNKHKSFIDFLEEEIIPINLKDVSKPKVQFTSIVTVKNPEGKILKVKFSKIQTTSNLKPDHNGIITIYERSPLALAIFGKTEGEICQLGMLEMYYEILKVE